jgi:hypothetical protein
MHRENRMTASELYLDLGTVTMNCTTDEVASTLAALLGEMRAVIPKLREDERDVLRQIMSQNSGTLTVAEVFPDFSRESEGHRTLRRLRAAQFVRPARTGRWDPDEPIEVKPFARLMWDHVGEDTIFDGVVAIPAAAPVDEVEDISLTAPEDSVVGDQPPAVDQPEVAEQPAEDVVDLDEVEAEEAIEKPASKVARAGKTDFEDDNVLDVGDLDELYAYAQEEVRGNKRRR